MEKRRARHVRPLWVVGVVLIAGLVACGGGGPGSNARPTASFVSSDTTGPAPLSVSFDASGSSDADGNVVAYGWDFGTGDTGTGVTTSHVYAQPGSYVARLTVTDDDGATASATVGIVVTGDATGRVAGTITVGAGTAGRRGGAVVARAQPPATVAAADLDEGDVLPNARPSGEADVVDGEWIVKFHGDLRPADATVLTVAGVRLESVRALAVPGTRLYRAPGLGRAETRALVDELAARPDVAYVVPNYRLHALATPDDTFYGRQWHYPAIELPAAWDITTGSVNTVVAVGDTGILFAAGNAGLTHPDFAGKVLPGYDFVSNPTSAGDLDGRDADAYDVGTSFHGSHVAGTIAAATNNTAGVAGVDWQARIVPVRMLGADGSGSLADVVDGLLWAAGFSVPGVPDNTNPAHVINLSLGGAYLCTAFEQEAFDRIVTSSPRDAIVVVAAGNDDASAAASSPSGCGNVITVGATEFRDRRAPYSNHGSRVDVMAPGGDLGLRSQRRHVRGRCV